MKNVEPILIVESVIFIVGIILYIRHFIVTDSIPHPVSFGIWLIADIINLVTYIQLSKFWVPAAIMLMSATILVIIGIVKMKKTHRERLKILDWVCIGIATLSLLIWGITQNALWSYLLIQIVIALGFVPIINKLFHKKAEPLIPWFIPIVGWIIVCVDVSMSCTSLVELIYPFFNGLLGASVVFVGSCIVVRQNAK